MSMQKLILPLSVLLVLLSGVSQNLEAITISQNGKSDYSIVLGNNASLSEEHAAKELQKFLGEIGGCMIPIIRENQDAAGPMILVGRSSRQRAVDNTIDFASLGNEGFVIRTKSPHLIIAGGTLRGTMYGVYTFLEEVLGCRWYTDEVSRIPSLSVIEAGNLDMRQIPAFEYREPFWSEAQDANWAARNKTNGSSTDLDDLRGGKIYLQGVHTYYYLVSPSRYFKDHPEYYSIIAKRRQWENAQLCETNPEMMKVMTRSMLGWIERSPKEAICTVGANDWFGICECEQCLSLGEREGSMSGPGLYLANAVAERVEKVYPDRYIGFLTYKHTVKPPNTLTPRDNIIIRMCPINDCKMHPIEEGVQNPEAECALNKELAEDLTGWNKISKKIYIWDYYTNFRQYLNPFPCLKTTEYDLRFYRDHNVKGMFMQGCGSTRGAYLSELKAYMQAKLLWNPDSSRDSIIDDFITGVYGKAAGPVREYVDLFENVVADRRIHASIREEVTVEYNAEDVLRQAEKLLASAKRIAADDPELAHRIEKLCLPVEFVRLSQPIRHEAQGQVYKAKPTATQPATTREVDLFMERVLKHKMTELRESRGHEEQYWRMVANVADHQIISVESPHLSMEILPAVGGRIYSLVHKKSGKNVLRIPELTDFRYPSTAGYEERIFRSSTIDKGPGYSEPYTCNIEETPRGTKVILTGRINSRGRHHDVQMRREITLLKDRPALEIRSTVSLLERNNLPLCINAGPFVDIGNVHDYKIGIKQANGKYEWHAIGELNAQVVQQQLIVDKGTYRDFLNREIQSGEWCVVNPETGIGIINTFDPSQVDVCHAKVSATENKLEMRLLGFEKSIEPGDELHIDQTITIVDNVGQLLGK